MLLLHQVGGGCPDLLVAWGDHNLLMEVKSPRGKLTPQQVTFHALWPGPRCVVSSVAEALAATGVRT